MDYSAQQTSNRISGVETGSGATVDPGYDFARQAEKMIAAGQLDEAYNLLPSGHWRICRLSVWISRYWVMCITSAAIRWRRPSPISKPYGANQTIRVLC